MYYVDVCVYTYSALVYSAVYKCFVRYIEQANVTYVACSYDHVSEVEEFGRGTQEFAEGLLRFHCKNVLL